MAATSYLQLEQFEESKPASFLSINANNTKVDTAVKGLADSDAGLSALIQALQTGKANTTGGVLSGPLYHQDANTPYWNNSNLPVEQGTWTPELAGASTPGVATYTNRGGHYRRIGDTVHLWGIVEGTIQEKGSGQLTISGFPFVSRNISYNPCTMYNLYAVSDDENGTLYGYTAGGQTKISLARRYCNKTYAHLIYTNAQFDVGKAFSFIFHITVSI